MYGPFTPFRGEPTNLIITRVKYSTDNYYTLLTVLFISMDQRKKPAIGGSLAKTCLIGLLWYACFGGTCFSGSISGYLEY